jgi:nitrogen fixation/metabolism regulation signal transduction histidine kinase
MTYLLIAGSAIATILLFLLAAASANTSLFGEHYPLLLALNGVVAAVLLGLVVYQGVALKRERRAKVFGSLLTFRVLVMFAIVAMVPGAIIYTVSVQFLTKSIESWFDVRVDKALEGGLNLGRAAIDSLLSDLALKTRAIAIELSDMPTTQQIGALNRLREQAGAEDALLITLGGQVVASASRDFGKLLPPVPSPSLLRQARSARQYSAVEPEGGQGLFLRVIVPLDGVAFGDEAKLVQLTRHVPSALAENADSVQSVYHAYKELALSRQGLKEIYILTLTLTLLLTLSAALGLAFLLSRRLSQPLAELAKGTQAVARGDFGVHMPVTSRDELGILTQSFNSMTRQLDEARGANEKSRAQVETAKAYLESVLANLSAGVLVFDAELRLNIANRGAEDILGQPLAELEGTALESWGAAESVAEARQPAGALGVFAASVAAEFRDQGAATWQRQIELPGGAAVLLLRGSSLPAAGGGGHVLVFDDITQLVAAQRATAWGEVARRLAHEIKNPLTPIQLSAERLQAKLAGRLGEGDAAVLGRAVETIVAQVSAMKNMVDDFREYARTPAPQLQPLDLNRLVGEVLALYENAGVPISVRAGSGLPLVLGDPTQIRQVIHNLLQNAQDALSGAKAPRIEISTEAAGRKVWLKISDNGCGFPEGIMKRAFEPYVTTKPKGTGLGLAIVKKIIDEHHGTITIENAAAENGAPAGAAVSISLPLAA